MKFRKSSIVENNLGFTLVELMITLAMSGIIVAAIYSAYTIQQKTYYTQGQVVEMQQNIRAALELMSSEIRMAGYDLTAKAGAAITTATASKFAFTANLNSGSGDTDLLDPNENVTFCLQPTGTDVADVDGCDVDGIATNTGTASVRRNNQSVADGIQAIEFYYILENGAKKLMPSSAELSQIKTVQITMLAVASQRDSKFNNTELYQTAWSIDPTHPIPHPYATPPPLGPFNDNFRRRLLNTSVNIRNQGLNP